MSYKVSSWRTISRYSHKGQGAHAGDIETFIEVEFDLDGKKVVPDGLIRVSRGSRVWAPSATGVWLEISAPVPSSAASTLTRQRKDDRRRRSTGWCGNSSKRTTVLGWSAM